MKRKLAIGVILAVLVILPTIIAYAQDHAGTEADPWPVPDITTIAFRFDNTYGTSQITKVRFQVYDATDAEVAAWEVEGASNFPQGEPHWSFPAYAQISTLPNNALYRFTCRVTDSVGNVSLFADPPCYFEKRFVTLPRPSGCRLFW